MKVVAVVQNKGGVGKTTITRLMAEYFSRKKYRVLGIDLDAQCNFSRRFLEMNYDPTDPDGVIPPLHPDFDDNISDGWDGRSSSSDIYFTGEVVFYPTELDNLDLLPGNGSKLRKIELVREEDVKEQVHDRLFNFCQLPDLKDDYDLVVIDTSPSKGPLTVSAVRAATHLVIPTTMEPQPIEGLFGMLQLWRRENRRRTGAESLKILAIQPNLVRKKVALHSGLLESLRNDEAVSSFLAPEVIYQHIAIAETDHPQAVPKSIFDQPKTNQVRQLLESICEFYERELFGRVVT